MKKWLLTVAVISTLTACSASNESKQQAGDTYQKSNVDLPRLNPLDSGGVKLPTASTEYQLPQIKVNKDDKVDIRPPSIPLAIIHDSITRFDGERALIAYTSDQQKIYNLKQIERLLKEQNIQYTIENGKLLTDWAATGRSDDLKNTQIRYQIEEVDTEQAAALMVSVLQMKRNETIYTPSITDKQRYASDRLNQLIGELNAAYQKQQQDLSASTTAPIASHIATDTNGRTALILSAPFDAAWEKLGETLPKLGFEIKKDMSARGIRELYYKPLSQKAWQQISSQALPNLGKGSYQMQLAALNKQQSAVVISEEKKSALANEQAQIIYQSLQRLLNQ